MIEHPITILCRFNSHYAGVYVAMDEGAFGPIPLVGLRASPMTRPVPRLEYRWVCPFCHTIGPVHPADRGIGVIDYRAYGRNPSHPIYLAHTICWQRAEALVARRGGG